MSDLISRADAIEVIRKFQTYKLFKKNDMLLVDQSEVMTELMMLPSADRQTGWIPVSERMPEHSYTKRFWLTVKLDDGTITTLIGTWGAWCGCNDRKSYDAFNCWKDTMINGGIYRLSQPIPKEQVLAWMPAPEPYREDGEA